MIADPPASTPVRFDCPACGAVLTVPAAAAGLQGPCPKCWQEIVSPDPAHGLPARLPAPPPAVPEPAAEPAEPAPAADLASTGIPPSPPRRSGRTGWIVPSLLCSLVFAGVGYQLGKQQSMPEEVVPPATPPAPTPAPDPLPDPAPETPAVPETPPIPETPPPPVEEPVPPAPEKPNPEATLRAFLEAPDWKTRGARVLSPGVILPAMEKHAAETGDGPIATTAVTLLEVAGPNHIFKVCTPSIPEGFPVAVSSTDEGPMIDWESFIGFHDDHFRKFLEGPVGKSGIFDLLVKPEPEEPGDAAALFVRYRLSVPMPNRETIAWIPRKSVPLARLKAIFDGSGGFDKATIDRLAGTGVPLVLALEKRPTNDGREFIEIKDFVAIGWGPAAP